MTLDEAIAEVKRATNYGPWQVGDIEGQAHNPLAHEIVRVLQAVASAELIPLADHKLAAALAYQRAADILRSRANGARLVGWGAEQAKYEALSDEILALADTDPLAEVKLLQARAATTRWYVREDGNLVLLCRGEHEKAEACTDHEEVFVPLAEVQELKRLAAAGNLIALEMREVEAEVQALKAERDAAREALMKAGIALHVAKRETADVEAEVALAYKRAADRVRTYLREQRLPLKDRSPGAHLGLADAILALADSDALAEVQALIKDRDHWRDGWKRAMGEFDAKCKEANEQRARAEAAEAEVQALKAERDAAQEENRWAYIQAAMDDRKTDAEAEVARLREALMDIADPHRLQSLGDPAVLRDRARAELQPKVKP